MVSISQGGHRLSCSTKKRERRRRLHNVRWGKTMGVIYLENTTIKLKSLAVAAAAVKKNDETSDME